MLENIKKLILKKTYFYRFFQNLLISNSYFLIYEKLTSIIESNYKDFCIYDLGCGDAPLAKYLSKNMNYIGIDINIDKRLNTLKTESNGIKITSNHTNLNPELTLVNNKKTHLNIGITSQDSLNSHHYLGSPFYTYLQNNYLYTREPLTHQDLNKSKTIFLIDLIKIKLKDIKSS